MIIELNQQEIGAISGSVDCCCLGTTLVAVAVAYMIGSFVARLDNIASCENWRQEGWKSEKDCMIHLRRWNV